jgi:hypothetical protein
VWKLNKQFRRADKGWSPRWGFGEGLTSLHREKPACYEMHRASDVRCSCEHSNEPSSYMKSYRYSCPCALTKHRVMKAYSGSGGIARRILDLDTRWRRVVSFTPRPLHPQGNSPWYPIDRRLSRPQSWFRRGGEEENSQPLPGLESPIIQPVAQRFTTELIRLLRVTRKAGNSLTSWVTYSSQEGLCSMKLVS